ncbi:MAG: RNA chaperone Hfq [Deltaproteobacteria bacterium]|jgi:host factor-I protein|nr:RNA chaperone Hfq [Deltaproteobacteria bacterium]
MQGSPSVGEQHLLVDVTLAKGEKLQCYIQAFDDEIIIIESSGERLLYKHEICAIASADGSFRAATE